MRKERQNAVERYVVAYNAFDLQGMLDELDDAIVFENYSGKELNAATEGLAAFRELAEKACVLFSKRHQKVERILFAGDRAIADIAYMATLALDISDSMKAGTKITMKGQLEFTFEGTKIIKLVDRS